MMRVAMMSFMTNRTWKKLQTFATTPNIVELMFYKFQEISV